MSINTRTVEYTVDGATFEGVLATSGDAARPAVMICHAWGGRKEHEEDMARKVAELGYTAFAADVYGKGVEGHSIEENQKLMTPLVEDREALQRRLRGALAAMNEQPEVDSTKVAVTGFCFGGLCSLDMARTNAPILGASAFHAVIGKPGKPQGDAIKPKVICFQGFDDPMADHEALVNFGNEMTRREADWQLHVFGGVSHAFTNPDANKEDMGLIYNKLATERSWLHFKSFLSELFA